MHFNMGWEVNSKHRGLDMIVLSKRKLYRAFPV